MKHDSGFGRALGIPRLGASIQSQTKPLAPASPASAEDGPAKEKQNAKRKRKNQKRKFKRLLSDEYRPDPRANAEDAEPDGY